VTGNVDPNALEEGIRAACAAADWERAATLAIEGYGDELFRFLLALARDQSGADDAFSLLSESVWRALPGFRWESSFRTWAYTLARHAWFRLLRDPHRRADRRLGLSDAPSLAQAVAAVRTRTITYLRTESRDKLEKLRATLAPEDQALLILRVGRTMAWPEIARVLADPDEPLGPGDLERRAARLRKRFQRIKDDLRAQLGTDDRGEG